MATPHRCFDMPTTGFLLDHPARDSTRCLMSMVNLQSVPKEANYVSKETY